ncbi:beta-L-arabinofuranosidase domain-containing protein [Atribacter laminatus]|uniref:Uncharacterized protein n=1 Tax=Atribacter laminatus TaxID=2847778 RepID=A0A7T1ALJ2_ATRLM|nr:beta-L-arabinofuranosidase domain-containing protein [Atribacter laminatus]QPM68148.1 hypothetical protein RT761_01362 [Atribacter laminatus]
MKNFVPIVPKTLNLEEHAELAFNHLTNNLDANRNFLPYFHTIFETDPAEARHEMFDYGDLTARYLDALILCRNMCGSGQGINYENKLKELLLGYFDENDGLCYRPAHTSLFSTAVFDADSVHLKLQKDLPVMYNCHVAELFDQSRTLIGLITWYKDSCEVEVKDKIDALIEGLDRISIKKDDYCYFSKTEYSPGYVPANDEVPNHAPIYFGGTLIYPLLKYYELTKSRKAFKLAEGLSKHIIFHTKSYESNGGFAGKDHNGQSHGHMSALTGLIFYSITINNQELLQWSKKAFDWFIQNGSSFGWFPEFIGRLAPSQEGCETCTINDVICCAILLARSGYYEYWDHIERFTRNQLVENQLRDTKWMKSSCRKEDTWLSSFDNIPERVRGGFAGWGGINDFIGSNPMFSHRMMNCCSPSGVHALYLVWENIVTEKNSEIYVNLLLNHRSKWLKLYNFMPYEGKIFVSVDNAHIVNIKIPTWVEFSQINFSINNENQDFLVSEGDYIRIKGLKPRDTIVIEFPLKKEVIPETIAGTEYKIYWRGNTVIRVFPEGEEYPLYQRNHLDSDQAIYEQKSYNLSLKRLNW